MKIIFIGGKCMYAYTEQHDFMFTLVVFPLLFICCGYALMCMCISLRYFLIENYIDLQNKNLFFLKKKK